MQKYCMRDYLVIEDNADPRARYSCQLNAFRNLHFCPIRTGFNIRYTLYAKEFIMKKCVYMCATVCMKYIKYFI